MVTGPLALESRIHFIYFVQISVKSEAGHGGVIMNVILQGKAQ
jgi:hypothetical protein